MSKPKSARKKMIILDTNFILAPIMLKLNIDKLLSRIEFAYELYIPSFCLKELERLEQKSLKLKKACKVARAILKRLNVKVLNEDLKEGETIDEALVRLAEKYNAIVATGDKEIWRRLREKGLPIIYIRAYKKLEIEGLI